MNEPLNIDLALDIASHWLLQKYPEYDGPHISWPAMPEIAEWIQEKTIPFEIGLDKFTSMESFFSAFVCACDYLDKLLRTSYTIVAEHYDIVTIHLRCARGVDPATSGFIPNQVVIHGRLIAKPKVPMKDVQP